MPPQPSSSLAGNGSSALGGGPSGNNAIMTEDEINAALI